ncbi:MAG TPA: response regulator [Stellaceae bacterium]|nr:response regulator [Stellaceae bacterium]
MPYALLLWAKECRRLASGLHAPGAAMELLLYAEALESEAGRRAIVTKGRASQERPGVRHRGEAPRFSPTENVGISMVADYRATVLVVDDDDAARDTAVVLLESLGYKAITARSDNDALGMMRVHSVDILFTDILAGSTVDGPQLARLAREVNPALAVVYTTRYSPMFLLDSEAPRDGLLVRKPWQRRELDAVLEKSTHQARA